jgi:ABC-2 type transport system permease protein
MTAPATARARSPFPALVGYALRTCLPPRRRLAMLLPCVAAVLFGLLVTTMPSSPSHDFASVAADGLFPLVLPVTALIVGDAVLGAERRRGTFSFTWMSPVPTWQIGLARWVGGTLVAGVSLAGSFALAAVVAGDAAHAGDAALAAGLGAAAYIAVFMAIGCIAQRTAVWSLAFVFLVERLLGAALSGIAQLSPSWEARAAFVGLAHAQSSLHYDGIPEGGAALVRLVVLTVVALAVVFRLLPRLRLSGSAD